jgi:hypothetical protein
VWGLLRFSSLSSPSPNEIPSPRNTEPGFAGAF